jgi:hypothetical protein
MINWCVKAVTVSYFPKFDIFVSGRGFLAAELDWLGLSLVRPGGSEGSGL